MKPRFILFRRSGVYYSEDTVTRKQHSLRTKDESEALTLLNAKNESFRQPVLNRQIARTYLAATDCDAAKRTWQTPMRERRFENTLPVSCPDVLSRWRVDQLIDDLIDITLQSSEDTFRGYPCFRRHKLCLMRLYA